MAAITSVIDLEAWARRRLPKVTFEYVCGGSNQQLTLQRNLDDLRALALRQHVMRDVSNRNTAVSMIGDRARIPLAIGPTGLAGLTWANGECEAAAGCSALVLTLDLHVQGQRWADAKNGLSVPPRLTLTNTLDMLKHAGWLVSMAKSKRRTFGNLEGEVKQGKDMTALAEWVEAQFDPSFDLDTVKWVRKCWKRTLILKGIMHMDDAKSALDVGADAIVVSNHGGRQLDSAPSSISVLPEIAEGVRGQIEVFFDGGIRTGYDIVKALGRGAHACLTGRAYLYGLAANGREGVDCALKLLEEELNECMALTGLKDVRNIPPGIVTPQPPL